MSFIVLTISFTVSILVASFLTLEIMFNCESMRKWMIEKTIQYSKELNAEVEKSLEIDED